MRPFTLAVCNTMEASRANSDRAARIITATIRAFPDAVAIGVIEAANLAADMVLVDYQLVHDTTRLDRAGVALLVDRDRVKVTRVRYRIGVRPYIAGHRIKMRRRWVLTARCRVDGRRRRIRVLHLPPPRFAALWATMIRRVGTYGADLADWNAGQGRVGSVTGKDPGIREVLGVTVPLWWRAGEPVAADVGGDHPAVAVTVRPPR